MHLSSGHAVGLVRSGSPLSVGVHLNITEFRPLTNNADLAPLLDSAGRFRTMPKWLVPTPALLGAVHAECHAQVEAVIRAGITPSHLDSHHQVHTFPQLYPAIRRLQADFQIFRLRRSKNVYAPVGLYTLGVLRWRTVCHTILRLCTHSITTDGFTDLPTFFLGAPDLRGIGTLEIMTHPGHPAFPDDERHLRSDQWRSLLKNHQLIGYPGLPI